MYFVQVDLGGLPAFVTNHIMKQEPFSIKFISEHLHILQRENALNKHKTLNSTDGRTTSDLPTPGTTHEEVRFSSISVGSNPLYQQSWSLSAQTPGTILVSKVGLGTRREQRDQLEVAGAQSIGRKISTVIEESENEHDSTVNEQSADRIKDQSLMFEVSMQTKRSGLSINVTKPQN